MPVLKAKPGLAPANLTHDFLQERQNSPHLVRAAFFVFRAGLLPCSGNCIRRRGGSGSSRPLSSLLPTSSGRTDHSCARPGLSPCARGREGSGSSTPPSSLLLICPGRSKHSSSRQSPSGSSIVLRGGPGTAASPILASDCQYGPRFLIPSVSRASVVMRRQQCGLHQWSRDSVVRQRRRCAGTFASKPQ